MLLLTGPEGEREPQREEIPCLAPEQSIKALGFWVNAKGDARKTVEELSRCAREWALAIAGSNLSRHLAWQGLRTTVGRLLAYHYPVSTMSWRQGDTIASQLYSGILPKLGAARCFPRAYRYAPRKFLGLGLEHPYVVQGV